MQSYKSSEERSDGVRGRPHQRKPCENENRDRSDKATGQEMPERPTGTEKWT